MAGGDFSVQKTRQLAVLLRSLDTYIPWTVVTTFLTYLQNKNQTSPTDYCVYGQNKKKNAGPDSFVSLWKNSDLKAENIFHTEVKNRLKVRYHVVLVLAAELNKYINPKNTMHFK